MWLLLVRRTGLRLLVFVCSIQATDKKGAAGAAAAATAAAAAPEEPVDTEAAERKKRADQLRAEAAEVEGEIYGPRITAADKANDRKSLRRKLDRKLFLIVKKDNVWQFPDTDIQQGSTDTVRGAAERALAITFAPSLSRYFVGNAPIGVDTFPLAPEAQQKRNTYGDKIFYTYAYYLKGAVTVKDASVSEHLWVTKDELSEYFDEKRLSYLVKVLPMEGLF